jgi:hypothetical protein
MWSHFMPSFRPRTVFFVRRRSVNRTTGRAASLPVRGSGRTPRQETLANSRFIRSGRMAEYRITYMLPGLTRHRSPCIGGCRSFYLEIGSRFEGTRCDQTCVDDAVVGEASSRSMATSSVCTGDVRSLNASIGFASVSRLSRVSRRMR